MAEKPVEMFAAAVCGPDGVQMFEHPEGMSSADQAAATLGDMAEPKVEMALSSDQERMARKLLVQRIGDAIRTVDHCIDDTRPLAITPEVRAMLQTARRALIDAQTVASPYSDTELSSPSTPALFADVGQQERVQRQEKEIEAIEETEPTEACNDGQPKKMGARQVHIAKGGKLWHLLDDETDKELASATTASELNRIANSRGWLVTYDPSMDTDEFSAAETLAAMATPQAEPVELAAEPYLGQHCCIVVADKHLGMYTLKTTTGSVIKVSNNVGELMDIVGRYRMVLEQAPNEDVFGR